MRKREILYSDIILHRIALLRQLKNSKSKMVETWEKQLTSNKNINNFHGVTNRLTNKEVIDAIHDFNPAATHPAVKRFMFKLHKFINELDHISYETWKGHCRKVRSREGKRTLTVEHSILEKVCTYLETTHQKTFDPHAIGKNEFQEAIETLLHDANNRKNI
ncbi:hypothetical protein CWB80_19410 [Pseudoalteromonas sp. S1650]|nr:hypothetical protein CWB80_19410 [Pseudoalteromonas sp. S1650]